MSSYHSDDRYSSDYPRRDQDRDNEFRFRGAASRDRSATQRHHSRDPPRRQHGDRDYHNNIREQHFNPRGSDRGYGRDWSDRDHVVREPTPPPQRPTGDDDVASGPNSQSPVLLIRRLKPSGNRQVLVKGLKRKLCRDEQEPEDESPLGAHPGSLRAVYFVCDCFAEQSLGYAFAEFHSTADAQAALRKAEVLGDQCTVSSQRFLADFADLNAFPIAAGGEQDGAAIQFRDDVQTRIYRTYHNRECYIDCEPVDMEPPPGYATSNRADDTAELQDDTYSLTETTSAVRHDGESTTRKRPKESHALGKSDEPRSKKVKADPVVPNQFATWSRKQAELRADVDAEDMMEADDAAPAIAEVAQSFICVATQKPRIDKENCGPLDSATKAASDLSTQVAICFLCGTIFAQSNSELHLSKSKLHSQRLQDTTRLDRAYAYMKKLSFAPERTVRIQVGTTADRNYFDRAKMRREQEKQQRRELRAQAKAGPKLKMSLGGGADEDATYPTAGIGASMLKKHGWSEGQGLGSGSGRTALVEQNMYAAGVGLGHESSRQGDAIEEANRVTRGGGPTFADKTLDAARQRFHDLNR